MQFLRENKGLLFPAFISISLFFFDGSVVMAIRDFWKSNPEICHLHRLFDPVLKFISNGATLIGASIIILYGRRHNRKLYDAGRSLFISLISAGVAVQVLKHLIGRARPRITDTLVFIGPTLKSGYDSFPSGHTALAFPLAYTLSRYFPEYRFLFYSFAVIVGLDRLDGLSHFPSDVVAGAILGTVVVKILSARSLIFKSDLIGDSKLEDLCYYKTD